MKKRGFPEELFYWKINRKNGAFSWSALNIHRTPMNLCDVFDNRQSQPCPAQFTASGLVDPVKTLKQSRQVFGGNTATGITNADDASSSGRSEP